MRFPRLPRRRGSALPFLAFAASALLAAAPGLRADSEPFRPLLGGEVVEEPLPYYAADRDRARLRYEEEGDEIPLMRTLLSRSRYWQQDGHLDVVLRLAPPPGIAAGETVIDGRLLDAEGAERSRFRIAPAPGSQFVFYPNLPSDFLGEGALELVWSHGDGTLAEARESFRVERFTPPAPESGRVRLEINNEPGTTVRGLPLTAGVPFPRGLLHDAARLRLRDEAGREVPAQVRETARWSKFGTLKWVLLDFTADLDGGPRVLHLEYGPEVVRTSGDPIAVALSEDGFPAIDAGRLRLDEEGIWFDSRGDGSHRRLLADGALGGAFVHREGGPVYRAPQRDDYEIEEHGPVKTVVRREGWYRAGSGAGPDGGVGGDEAWCRYLTRYVVHRDSPVLRIFHTWLFTGDGNRDRIRNMGWEFPLAEGLEPGGFLSAFGEDGQWLGGERLVQWDFEHFDTGRGGERAEHRGGRAAGAARAVGEGGSVYFGAKDFWQNFPSELEFRDGSLFFHNWPRHNRPAGYRFDGELLTVSGEPAEPSAARHRRYQPGRLTLSEWRLNAVQLRFAHEGESLSFRLPDEFAQDPIQAATGHGRETSLPWEEGKVESANAQGISRTEEMWLYLAGPDEDGEEARRVLQGLNDETLRAVVDPVWVAASGAFYEMHPRDPERFPEEERAYELLALSPERIRERLGVYGMWIYGDLPVWEPRLDTREPALYRAYRKRHHGWPYTWKAYARSGDPRLLKIAEASTRQMVDANYCHYLDEEVAGSLGEVKKRRLGRWHRGLLPWGGRDQPTIRCYESGTDFLWHAHYLTGCQRARENALHWGIQTRVFDPEPTTGSMRRFSREDRASVSLFKSYIEMYEATFDPWFLVAMHEMAKGHLEDGTRAEEIRTWEPAEREFHRFTGDEAFREHYLRYAASVTDHTRHHTWSRASPQLAEKAYAWGIGGGDYFLRRAARAIEFGTAQVQTEGGPDYLLGFPASAGQGTGYTLFASFYLRWFPTGLWALAQAEDRPPAINNTNLVTGAWEHEGEDSPAIFVTLRKREGEPLPFHLDASAHDYREATGRGGEHRASYRVTGSDGTELLSGVWELNERLPLEIPASAPAGDCLLRVDIPQELRGRGLRVPVTGVDHPEVLRLPEARAPRWEQGSPLWFFVPEGVERFSVQMPRAGWTAVWSPDGRRAHHFGTQPEGSESARRVEIEVAPEHRGRLWRLTHPEQGLRLDPRIPPVFAVDPTRWYLPDALAPEDATVADQ